MFYKRTLDNGIRVVAEKMPHLRSVTVGIWFGAGSVREKDCENGISHFIEHMLFKGTSKRTAKQIAAEMDAIGGQLNAFTSKECTCYYARVMDERIETGLDILSDLVCNSRMDGEEMQKEKGVVLEEIAMVEDTPEDLVHELLAKSFFDGHPLARTVLGPAANIAGFNRGDLQDYMQRYYSADNMVVSIAGNFEMDKAMDLIDKYLGDMQKGKAHQFDFPAHANGSADSKREKDTEQIHLCLGFPGFGQDTPENYALNVLNNVFGGSMSSWLFQSIREERGMAYSIYSYPSAYSATGMFTIYLGTKPGNAEEAYSVILEQIDLLKKQGITDEEFSQGKEQLKASYILGQESSSSRMISLGKSELLLGRTFSERDMLDRIESVDRDSVRDIVPQVFDERKMCRAMVGKIGDVPIF
ncbi:MAG: M16 family metallopeptidase [Christensenellales bacterium]